MNRKICVVTGSRAEFGLLCGLMHEISQVSGLVLQVVVTGMHLSTEFGLTYTEVEQSGFIIDQKVDMLVANDSATAITKSIGLGTIGFADAFSTLKPDLIVVLGDRFELISVVTAAMIASIPVAHLHGGEVTEGAFDETIRHSITKMSHLHFVAAADYARRVIQLGEQPKRVFMVGGLGVDSIKRMKLLDKEALEAGLGFNLGEKNILVTFHPVTLERESSVNQMKALLEALDKLEDTHLIFTMPNADTGGLELAAMVKMFVRSRSYAKAYTSLGQLRYLSCMQFVDGVVGNSSSGLAEAPSLGIGTVNIGNRQQGRLSANSVIHCTPDCESISRAIQQLYDPKFRETLAETISPYGGGGACKKIIAIIKDYPLDGLLKKNFYDSPNPA